MKNSCILSGIDQNFKFSYNCFSKVKIFRISFKRVILEYPLDFCEFPKILGGQNQIN